MVGALVLSVGDFFFRPWWPFLECLGEIFPLRTAFPFRHHPPRLMPDLLVMLTGPLVDHRAVN